MIKNINEHGAWIAVGNRGTDIEYFATVDDAGKRILELVHFDDPVDQARLEGWMECLATNKPGSIDCYGEGWPIFWYHPDLDEAEFEVNDYEDWERAVEARKKASRE